MNALIVAVDLFIKCNLTFILINGSVNVIDQLWVFRRAGPGASRAAGAFPSRGVNRKWQNRFNAAGLHYFVHRLCIVSSQCDDIR